MRSLLPSLAALLLLGAGPAAVRAQEQGDVIAPENCTIGCQNDAVCRHGKNPYAGEPKNPDGSPFAFHEENSREGEYCDCTDDFTGVRCNRPKQVCGEGSDHVCYHGGKCITSANVTITKDKFFCDCTDAKYDGLPYVGKFCEHEGANKCGPEDKNPDHRFFCLNHGECKENFWEKPHPCKCPDGFRGPHCEFQDGHVPACNLDCENGGQCFIGLKTYEQTLLNDYWMRHDGKFQYCSCPEGYFGPKCEIRGVECGPSFCFNGGACVETLGENKETVYNCDCTGAHTEEASFGGRFCQSESTSFCQKQNTHNNGHLFCTNGGKCNPDKPHDDCECPEGFHGPICEFHPKEETQKCNLTCENGGKCRHGAKEVGTLLQFGQELEAYTNQTHIDWEHCVCPDGFFGVRCEHEVEICNGGDHVCLHGSKCVPKNENDPNDKSHDCNCEAGFDAFEQHAGKYCQYSSTDICTRDRRQGTGRSAFNFCVNNGKCKAQVDHNSDHPGCDCPEGFEGEHCEFLAKSESSIPEPKSSGGSKNSGALVALIVVCIVFFGVVAAYVVFRRRRATKDPTVVADDVNLSPRAESSPAVFEAEGTVVVDGKPTSAPEDGEMQTVQIC